MDLPAMLVELPLQGFHRRYWVPGQPRSANRKVFVATGALAVQPRFVILGDLKMWLFHASSMAQLTFQFQMAKIQTASVDFGGDGIDIAAVIPILGLHRGAAQECGIDSGNRES
jgi:hypothetical protein